MRPLLETSPKSDRHERQLKGLSICGPMPGIIFRRRNGHEEEQIQRRADRRFSQAGRGWQGVEFAKQTPPVARRLPAQVRLTKGHHCSKFKFTGLLRTFRGDFISLFSFTSSGVSKLVDGTCPSTVFRSKSSIQIRPFPIRNAPNAM